MPSCVATVSDHIIVTLAHLQTHILYCPLLLQLAAAPEPLWLTYRHISVLLSPAATCSCPRAPLAHLQTHICTVLSCCNLQVPQSPSGSLTDTYLYYSPMLRLVADPEPLWLTHRLMSNNLLYCHAATSSQHSHLGSHKGLFVLLGCD